MVEFRFGQPMAGFARGRETVRRDAALRDERGFRRRELDRRERALDLSQQNADRGFAMDRERLDLTKDQWEFQRGQAEESMQLRRQAAARAAHNAAVSARRQQAAEETADDIRRLQFVASLPPDQRMEGARRVLDQEALVHLTGDNGPVAADLFLSDLALNSMIVGLGGEPVAAEAYEPLSSEGKLAMDARNMPELAGLAETELNPAPPEPEGADPSLGNTLRDDLSKELADFGVVSTGYETIQELAKQGTGVADTALIVAFTKILDPGSVAREGEVAAVQANIGRLVQRFGAQVQNAWAGTGSLDEASRNAMIEAAGSIYGIRRQGAEATLAGYQGVADSQGVPMEWVYPRGSLPGPALDAAPEPVAGEMPPPPTGMEPDRWQELWDLMPEEDRAKFQ